jgi:hypothetical protein
MGLLNVVAGSYPQVSYPSGVPIGNQPVLNLKYSTLMILQQQIYSLFTHKYTFVIVKKFYSSGPVITVYSFWPKLEQKMKNSREREKICFQKKQPLENEEFGTR